MLCKRKTSIYLNMYLQIVSLMVYVQMETSINDYTCVLTIRIFEIVQCVMTAK